MSPDNVTACIVTRGNVDLAPILDSLIFDKVIVWDNSKEEDLGVFGRFAAAERAKTKTVYFQDDDVVVPAITQRALLREHKPGLLVTNMEEWRNRDAWQQLVWIGWGAIVCKADIRRAFAIWRDAGGEAEGPAFLMVGCDMVVGMLIPARRFDLAREHLPYAYGHDRVYRQKAFGGWKTSFYSRLVPLIPEKLAV